MKRVEIHRDEWLAALADANRERVDIVPPGWITLETFTRRVGAKNEDSARFKIKVLLETARAEKRRFHLIASDGSVRPVTHYRLTKPPKHGRGARNKLHSR